MVEMNERTEQVLLTMHNDRSTYLEAYALAEKSMLPGWYATLYRKLCRNSLWARFNHEYLNEVFGSQSVDWMAIQEHFEAEVAEAKEYLESV